MDLGIKFIGLISDTPDLKGTQIEVNEDVSCAFSSIFISDQPAPIDDADLRHNHYRLRLNAQHVSYGVNNTFFSDRHALADITSV